MKYRRIAGFMRLPVLILNINLFLILLPGTSYGQKEIEVTSFYAKVYVAPSTNANFIGLTQKGERYPILGIRDTWYNIRFKNANGWIEFSQVRIFDPNAVVEEQLPTDTADQKEEIALSADTVTRKMTAESSASTAGITPATSSVSEKKQESGHSAVAVNAPRQVPKAPQAHRPATTRPSARENRPSEKKESLLRSWFTQPNLPELPTSVGNEEEPQIMTQRYFQVRFPARVLEFLSHDAPILGMTKRGQLLPLVYEGDSWCRVGFADTIGWIESKYGKILDPATTVSIDYMKVGVIGGGILFLLAVVVIVIVRMTRRKNRSTNEDLVKKNMLIVSRSNKTIQYTLTNGTTTLERCFSEIGFSISYAREVAGIKNYLQLSKPDVILVDQQFDSGILSALERICTPLGIGNSVMVIVYNVPDPAGAHPSQVLPRMAFLGLTFSDRDIYKLVTPLLRSSNGAEIQKSVQSSALAGNIADGNLLEVLQFIEIGSKTGCLLIEMEKPFAIICFKNGRIIFAASSDKTAGREAIFKVLDLKIGKFRFVLDKRPKESNVNLSTLEVLMEWAKATDEAHGH